MKILYHHRIRSKDGQFVHLEELVNSFRANGHEVQLVGPAVVESGEFGADGGAIDSLKRLLPAALFEVLELFYSFWAMPRLVMAILKERPDFLYERYNLFFPTGAWVSRFFRIPYVLEVNGPIFEERIEHNGLSLKMLARWSQKFVWQRADLILPVTQVLSTYLIRYGVDPQRILVLQNGVEFGKFSQATGTKIREKFGMTDRFVLGFTGFVRPWHDVESIISAIASGTLGNKASLLIVGDGPSLPVLKSLVKALNVEDRVKFAGLVNRNEVQDYVAAFDVALQPAVTSYASPLKVMEYFAAGKAIVAPDQENIRELISHGENGLLFDLRDKGSQIAAINRISESSALRNTLGGNAQATVARLQLSWVQNAIKIVNRVDEILKTNAKYYAKN